MLRVPGSIPRLFIFSFFAHGLCFELATEKRKTMLVASVSFFNELATEKRNYAHATEKRNYALLDHGFQEDNALEGHHVKGQNSVMASKRSSLDGR
jgi:hypothetical protein